MELRRTVRAIGAFLLLLSLVVSVAATQDGVVDLGRICVSMPQITVELKGTGYTESDISASLGAEPLHLEGVSVYDPAADTTRVYILVDLSTSMRGSFDLVKTNIVTFIEAMGDSDQLVLITFGEKTVDTVLTGGEEKEAAIAAVKNLRCNEKGTLFYEALSRAYQMSSSSTEAYDREYVLAFSDGIDYQKGSTTFNETLDQYDSRVLPLYAACSGNTSKSGADQFGQIARTSGGGISIIKSEADFSSFMAQINDVTLLRFRGGSNRADGKEKQLTLKIDALQVEHNVPIVRSQPDEQPPAVASAAYDPDKEAIVIAFSEKVLGASDTNAYKVTGPSGTTVAVSGVYYDTSEDAYELRLADTVWNGSYTVSFSGITDASQEENPLHGEEVILVNNGVEPTEPETAPTDPSGQMDGSSLLIWGIAVGAVILLLIVVVAVVLVVLSKKKTQEEEVRPLAASGAEVYEYAQSDANVVKHHIKADSSVRIRLRIVTGKTSEQNIETNLVSSLIVGRSDACDIYIDDTKMSRQHFVLENDGGELYIMDLQSRNGTMLNGIRISSRHVLHSGDRILTGLSEIIITVIGR